MPNSWKLSLKKRDTLPDPLPSFQEELPSNATSTSTLTEDTSKSSNPPSRHGRSKSILTGNGLKKASFANLSLRRPTTSGGGGKTLNEVSDLVCFSVDRQQGAIPMSETSSSSSSLTKPANDPPFATSKTSQPSAADLADSEMEVSAKYAALYSQIILPCNVSSGRKRFRSGPRTDRSESLDSIRQASQHNQEHPTPSPLPPKRQSRRRRADSVHVNSIKMARPGEKRFGEAILDETDAASLYRKLSLTTLSGISRTSALQLSGVSNVELSSCGDGNKARTHRKHCEGGSVSSIGSFHSAFQYNADASWTCGDGESSRDHSAMTYESSSGSSATAEDSWDAHLSHQEGELPSLSMNHSKSLPNECLDRLLAWNGLEDVHVHQTFLTR